MSELISDLDQSEFKKHAHSIIWGLFIDYWQIEPHYVHQNYSGRHYKTIKHLTKNIIGRTGAPVCMCIIYLMCVCFLLNHTYYGLMNYMPITKATVYTVEIIPSLYF